MKPCPCNGSWCAAADDDVHSHLGEECPGRAPAKQSRCSHCEGATTGPVRGGRWAGAASASQRLEVASSVATSLGKKPGKKLGWESLPKEHSEGTGEGMIQISTKRLIPFPEVDELFRKETVVQLVLVKGDTPLLDADGQSAGLKSGFEQVAGEDGVVKFDRCFFHNVSTTKEIVRKAEARNGTDPPARRRPKGQPAPDPFDFWFYAQIIDPHGKPPRAVALKKQWRFRMVSKLDLIKNQTFLDWRLKFNAPYNPRVSSLNSDSNHGNSEATSSSANSSKAAPAQESATIILPPRFGDDPLVLAFPGLSGMVMQNMREHADRQFGFTVLVSLIVKTIRATGSMERRGQPLDSNLEQELSRQLTEALFDPEKTRLLFDGKQLTPDDMSPLGSLVQRTRLDVDAPEAVVAVFKILAGYANPPSDPAPVSAEGTFPALFPDVGDPLATLATMPALEPGSPPPRMDLSVELIHVKEELVKEEAGVDDDVAILRAFMKLSPDERVGARVVCNFQLDDGSIRPFKGTVTRSNSQKPFLVDILFDDGEEVTGCDEFLVVELPK